MPKDIVVKLNAEMVKIIQSPDLKKRMEEIGAEPVGDTPAQKAAQIKDDTTKYARLLKEAKVEIEKPQRLACPRTDGIRASADVTLRVPRWRRW